MKTYRKLTRREHDQALIQIMNVLLDDSIPQSGEHRRDQWNKGWAENVKTGDVTPKYFGKYRVNRLNGEFVWALSPTFEQDQLYSIVDGLAKERLTKVPVIYEFGCGTGHNLLRIQKINPTAKLIGCDWAPSSQELVNSLGFLGRNFDYFNPTGELEPHAGVYTVASLEQVGTDYKKFVNFLLENKPDIVVHIEPIPELLDSGNLLDYLSIKYMEKRKYLSGYLDYLRWLERLGKISIIQAERTWIGSFLIDGYSEIVWKPK